jgi:hypothetical protein
MAAGCAVGSSSLRGTPQGIPVDRTAICLARGSYAALLQGINYLDEGEICYAEDQEILYVVTVGVVGYELTPASRVPASVFGSPGATPGIVYLARDTDVAPSTTPGSTTPDALAVARAAQLKALNDYVSALGSGQVLLGTYDASQSEIASISTNATAGGRSGFTPGGQVKNGSGQMDGDFFIVSVKGTPVGDAPPIDVPLNVNDQLVWLGSTWTVIPSGSAGGDGSIHGAVDVSDSEVYVIPPDQAKGLLMRDSSVGDGMPGAYKLVNRIDLGSY